MSVMTFCETCDNMMYVKVSEENKMFLECKYCGNVVRCGDGGESVLVSSTDLGDRSSRHYQHITPHLHEDPSLPRVDYIPCPSAGCTRKKGEPNRVVYIKYDAANLGFLYSCGYCSHTWTS